MVHKLSTEKRTRIIAALVKGTSIRATSQMTGAAKNTVIKLLRDIGAACSACQDRTLRNPPCRRLQVHGIWSFVYAKAKKVPPSKACGPGIGDIWLDLGCESWLGYLIETDPLRRRSRRRSDQPVG